MSKKVQMIKSDIFQQFLIKTKKVRSRCLGLKCVYFLQSKFFFCLLFVIVYQFSKRYKHSI